jgi:CBS domain containing-hemolysin-like protein
VLIAEPESEEIVASIAVRTLRPSQMDSLDTATEPVIYVPWSATVADTFELLQAADRPVAAVVNEYGDTIGVLTIDVILEGILRLHAGRPPEVGSEAHFEVVSDGVWRVSGMMSVRRLAEHLGAALPDSRNVTIAGLMQSENERFPRVGDSCRWDRFMLQVVEAASRGQVRIEIREAPKQGDEA